MYSYLKSTVGAVFCATLFCPQSAAQSLPPVLTNLSATPDDSFIDHAFLDRIKSTYPRDIGSITLGKLLDLDGFDIESTSSGLKASLAEYKFPCITSYIVTWTTAPSGQAELIAAHVSHKCY